METTPIINEILVWFWRFAGKLITSLQLANCSLFVPRRRETNIHNTSLVLWIFVSRRRGTNTSDEFDVFDHCAVIQHPGCHQSSCVGWEYRGGFTLGRGRVHGPKFYPCYPSGFYPRIQHL